MINAPSKTSVPKSESEPKVNFLCPATCREYLLGQHSIEVSFSVSMFSPNSSGLHGNRTVDQ
jgi:hypothetical protein